MSARRALRSIGATTKLALLASQGEIADCLSPTNPSEGSYGNIGPILFWLNLDSKGEVDELFAQWKAAHARSKTGDGYTNHGAAKS
jgi:hypothetical protein